VLLYLEPLVLVEAAVFLALEVVEFLDRFGVLELGFLDALDFPLVAVHGSRFLNR
jgi:hypothetical protein